MKMEKTINIVGIGMGNIGTLTIDAMEIIKNSNMVIGGKRMIDSLEPYFENKNIVKDYSIAPLKIFDAIKNSKENDITVLMSGDTGFFSGTKNLKKLLDKETYKTNVVPGISSLSYLSSKVSLSWDEFKIVSLHGRNENPIIHVMNNEKVFFLLDKIMTPSKVCQLLIEADILDLDIIVGENLSYPSERITIGNCEKIANMEFETLSVMMIIRKDKVKKTKTHGIDDDEFIRGKTPMTKYEVRALSISKLGICEDDIIYDVGAGTGSVAIEMALQTRLGKVYAIETNEEALCLIKENKKKFNVYNLEVIAGLAPMVMKELETPTKVFIGGSKGNMKEIILSILEKNERAKFVVLNQKR